MRGGKSTRRVGQLSGVAVVICLLVVAAVPPIISVTSAQESTSCSLSQTQIQVGEEVTLDASASENATAYRFARDENATFGPWQDSPQYQFAYDEPGTYHPRVEVLNSEDSTDIAPCGTLSVGNEPPTPEFTYSPDNPETGEEVNFTSTSTDSDGEIVEYEWRIDGQVVSRESTVRYRFETTGEHLVELVVWDDDGANGTVEASVTVETENTPPTANINVDPSAPSPGEEVTIAANASDPDGSVTEYQWRVDGEVVSTNGLFTYTFTETGDHLLEVTVIDDDGATAVSEQAVTVTETNTAPTVNISASPTNPTVDETVSFTATASDPDGNITAYEWRLNGEIVSTNAQFTYAFSEVGDHLIEVTVVDEDGATSVSEKVVTVTEANSPPTVSISASPSSPIVGEPVTLTATASDPDGQITAYEWRLDGEVVSSESATEVTFSESGTHRVSLTVIDDNGASATANTTVSVAASTPTSGTLPVTADWWYTPATPRSGERVSLIAEGDQNTSLTYQWDIGADGTVERTGVTVGYTFADSGTYEVTLTVVGPEGARNTQTQQVRVQESGDVPDSRADPPFVMIPETPRPGETVTLVADPPPGAGPIQRFEWDLNGDGETDKRGWTVTFRIQESKGTVVTLETTYQNGTVQTQSSSLSTKGEPTVNRTGRDGPSLWTIPANPRPNQTVTLVADAVAPSDEIDAYHWDFDGDNVTDKEGATVTYTFGSDGQHRVGLTINRSNGTSATVERMVPVGDAERPSDIVTPASDDNNQQLNIGLPGLLGIVALAVFVVALLGFGWRRINT